MKHAGGELARRRLRRPGGHHRDDTQPGRGHAWQAQQPEGNTAHKEIKQTRAEGKSSRRAMVGGHGAERRNAAGANRGPELDDD